MEEENNVVTSESVKNLDMITTEIQLTEEELVEKKLMLQDCQINKDETDLELAMMEARLDKRIDAKMLDEDIAELEKDLADGKNKQGKDATPAEKEYMALQLEQLIKTRDLDIPMRKLRFNIAQARYTKNRPDAKEQQIKKLEREVRERKATVLKSRAKDYPKIPNMVG